MNADIQRAINAEKSFNNKNNLLITVHNQELNENSFKKLNRNIKNVHILQPEFVPKLRYIIELQDLNEVETIKQSLLRSQFFNLTISFLDHITQSYKNIDPYKLHVKNLPLTITDKEIRQIYPLCTQYHFVKSETRNTKSILAYFTNVKDAVTAFNTTNKVQFRSNNLKVQFFRDKSKNEDSNEEHTDSEDDVSKWEKIEEDRLKNKKVSDTLFIRNFPLDTTGEEVIKLYPQCSEYHFLYENSSTKSAIVKFSKIEDAVKMFTESNNIFKSNILHFEFYFNDRDRNNKKRKTENQDTYKEDQSRSNLNHFDKKLNEEGIETKSIDSRVLHVENLPPTTTTEDLNQLFPDHQQYQIIPDKISNSSSAYICFNTPFEALQAFKSNKNKIYKRKMLSVKFKSKKLKLNPFALKQKLALPQIKQEKKSVNTTQIEDDDVVVIEDKTTAKIINEDDIECKSEDEIYDDDIYVPIDIEDEIDNEDNISNESDFQGIDLDDDDLPLDDDDF